MELATLLTQTDPSLQNHQGFYSHSLIAQNKFKMNNTFQQDLTQQLYQLPENKHTTKHSDITMGSAPDKTDVTLSNDIGKSNSKDFLTQTTTYEAETSKDVSNYQKDTYHNDKKIQQENQNKTDASNYTAKKENSKPLNTDNQQENTQKNQSITADSNTKNDKHELKQTHSNNTKTEEIQRKPEIAKKSQPDGVEEKTHTEASNQAEQNKETQTVEKPSKDQVDKTNNLQHILASFMDTVEKAVNQAGQDVKKNQAVHSDSKTTLKSEIKENLEQLKHIIKKSSDKPDAKTLDKVDKLTSDIIRQLDKLIGKEGKAGSNGIHIKEESQAGSAKLQALKELLNNAEEKAKAIKHTVKDLRTDKADSKINEQLAKAEMTKQFKKELAQQAGQVNRTIAHTQTSSQTTPDAGIRTANSQMIENTFSNMNAGTGAENRSELVSQNMGMRRMPMQTMQSMSQQFTQQVMDKLVQRAHTTVTNTKSQLVVQLKPEALGKMKIQATMENQILSIKVTVENADVKRVLETNLQQLRQEFQNENSQLGELEVEIGTHERDFSMDESQDSDQFDDLSQSIVEAQQMDEEHQGMNQVNTIIQTMLPSWMAKQINLSA